MDTKSLAKSKRAHSLHHKKHHPNQKAKGATHSVAPPGTGKAPGKAVKEKARVGPAALASNWDRYEDEDDPMTEEKIDGHTSQLSDVVVPKSKGADYAYLISEAKSQNSTRMSSEIFPSLDDFISDFGQGKESFFAVQGESLLSSIQYDSFFVEDKTHANYEASFFSLNMDALAKQLTKIDLPKRLFMEADLFPPKQDSENALKRQAYDDHEVTSSTTTTTSSARMSPMVHLPAPNSNQKPVASSSANPSKLTAETAETELDMLLDSFNVNLMEQASSTLTSKKHAVDFDIDGTLDDLLKEPSTLLDRNNPSQSQPVSKLEQPIATSKKHTIDFDIDGTLDDLLKESSTLHDRNNPSQSQPVSKSEQPIASSKKQDDTLDDLLKEASTLLDRNNPSQSQHVSKSEQLDFDSWFDTI